jgi:glycerol-3-phosphate acyltransferase PlsY
MTMMQQYDLILFGTILFGYILGSINGAILFCAIFNLPDPRINGSGNPGATNVLRVAGRKLAIMTLIADIIKGAAPIWLGVRFGLVAESVAWAGLAAFIGHLYPIFFRFKGGKGVATGFGVILALYWPLAAAVLAAWLLVMVCTRYVALSSVIAALVVPMLAWWWHIAGFWPLAIMTVLIILRHQQNIQRLVRGEEDRFRWKR